MEYKFSDIEEEVKKIWKEMDVYRTSKNEPGKKFYVLDMFPYPSGAGLHVGHPLGYIASDIYARYKRLRGFNVLHPMGFDSFGLPAEQYAIQTGQHPAVTTEKNIATFKEQLDKIGFSFDWSRELRTSDPGFYKWTQWIFIRLFHSWYNKKTDHAENIDSLIEEFVKSGNVNIEAATDSTESFSGDEWKNFTAKEQSDILLMYRVAYLADSWVNWCPALGTVLANDEVKDGVSERGGYPVERKLMKQWSLRITAYADRLLSGLEKIEWSAAVKETQRNWIGRSEGCVVKFEIGCAEGSDEENAEDSSLNAGVENFSKEKFSVEVFTTRPDTIFGATFITLAPEHELVFQITAPEYNHQVNDYVAYAKNRSERDRMTDVKKITGQFTGAYAIHPFTQKPVPVWIGEYVLATYGTGAVMGVPGHDERDHRFAKHFSLPIISILEGVDVSENSFDEKTGTLCNSDFLNGLSVPDAIQKALDEIEKGGIGERKINFKLRDAIFGRQRYWGEPIPIYYDEEGIPHTVDESDLPIKLPDVDKYLPTEDGEPPLARAMNWKYTPPKAPLNPRSYRIGRVPEGETYLPHGSLDSHAFGYETSNKLAWETLKQNARANRRNSTKAEAFLWKHLSNHQLGEHFRRQHAIGSFIADFVCLKKKLIVEVDGGIHLVQVEEDKAREKELEKFGFTIIRFQNEEVLKAIDEVINKIKNALQKQSEKISASGELMREQVLPFGEDLGGANPPRGNSEGRTFPLELTTMPGWAGSSWYFLRYADPHNQKEFASKESIDYWQNIDLYVGGDEHATGHLLYFRFWTKFLFDLGLIPFDEPAKKLVNQGKIQGRSLYLDVFDFHNDQDKIEKVIASFDLYGGSVNFNNEIYQVGSSTQHAIPLSFLDEKDRLTKSRFKQLIESDSRFNNVDLEKNVIWKNEKEMEFVLLEPLIEKMSKRFGNIVNPDDVVEKYGADAFRLYEMFLGPLEQSKPWDTKGIDGVYRFLKKFMKLFYSPSNLPEGEASYVQTSHENEQLVVTDEEPTKDELKILHRTIKKVTEDIEALSYNTSVSAFMICVNELGSCHKKKILEPLLIILSPFAPFATEYLWRKLGYETSITHASFPDYDPDLLIESSFEYPVAINGKTRVKMNFNIEADQEEIVKEVMTSETLQKYYEGKTPKKVIVVKGRMINVVV